MKTNFRSNYQEKINLFFFPKTPEGNLSIKKIAGLILGGAIAWLLASIGNTVIFGGKDLAHWVFTKEKADKHQSISTVAESNILSARSEASPKTLTPEQTEQEEKPPIEQTATQETPIKPARSEASPKPLTPVQPNTVQTGQKKDPPIEQTQTLPIPKPASRLSVKPLTGERVQRHPSSKGKSRITSIVLLTLAVSAGAYYFRRAAPTSFSEMPPIEQAALVNQGVNLDSVNHPASHLLVQDFAKIANGHTFSCPRITVEEGIDPRIQQWVEAGSRDVNECIQEAAFEKLVSTEWLNILPGPALSSSLVLLAESGELEKAKKFITEMTLDLESQQVLTAFSTLIEKDSVENFSELSTTNKLLVLRFSLSIRGSNFACNMLQDSFFIKELSIDETLEYLSILEKQDVQKLAESIKFFDQKLREKTKDSSLKQKEKSEQAIVEFLNNEEIFPYIPKENLPYFIKRYSLTNPDWITEQQATDHLDMPLAKDFIQFAIRSEHPLVAQSVLRTDEGKSSFFSESNTQEKINILNTVMEAPERSKNVSLEDLFPSGIPNYLSSLNEQERTEIYSALLAPIHKGFSAYSLLQSIGLTSVPSENDRFKYHNSIYSSKNLFIQKSLFKDPLGKKLILEHFKSFPEALAQEIFSCGDEELIIQQIERISSIDPKLVDDSTVFIASKSNSTAARQWASTFEDDA